MFTFELLCDDGYQAFHRVDFGDARLDQGGFARLAECNLA